MGIQGMTENTHATRFDNTGIRLRSLNIMSKFGVYVMIALLLILGTIVAPDIFLTLNNMIDIIEVGALLGVVALGVTFVTYSGNFVDMSIPSIMAFSGIIAVQLLPYGLVVSIIGVAVTGCFIGAINGFMIGKLKANPIIWTLAVQFLISGMLKWAYTGNQIYPDAIASKNMKAVEGFYAIYRTRFFDTIPLIVIIMVVLAVICQIVLSKTRFGQQLRLTGSNIKAAKFSGINTERTVWIAFVLCGMFGGIGGLLLSSLSKLGAFYMGEGYDFNTITAIVLGGVTLFGGRGNFVGVIGGVITIGLMSNIMTFIGLGTFQQLFVKGLVFIVIVWLNTFSLRKLGKDYV
jgi:ribose/xylose/arabinose/galactoside ABC-type transport system permease subunit